MKHKITKYGITASSLNEFKDAITAKYKDILPEDLLSKIIVLINESQEGYVEFETVLANAGIYSSKIEVDQLITTMITNPVVKDLMESQVKYYRIASKNESEA